MASIGISNKEHVEFIDQLKEQRGLSSRAAVVADLIAFFKNAEATERVTWGHLREREAELDERERKLKENLAVQEAEHEEHIIGGGHLPSLQDLHEKIDTLSPLKVRAEMGEFRREIRQEVRQLRLEIGLSEAIQENNELQLANLLINQGAKAEAGEILQRVQEKRHRRQGHSELGGYHPGNGSRF